jgi:hypothetical protein
MHPNPAVKEDLLQFLEALKSCYKVVGVKRERGVILLGRYLAKYNPNE